MTNEKDGIILVGVDHKEYFLDKIKKIIDSFSVETKSIGIEGIFPYQEKIFNDWTAKVTKNSLQKTEIYEAAQKAGIDWFWARIAVHAAGKGLKIVSIDSKFATEQSSKLLELADFGIRELKKKGQIIAVPLRDEFMVHRIKKLKPELVLVGSVHVNGIKNAIPVRKLAFVGTPASLFMRLKFWLRRRQLSWFRKKRKLRGHINRENIRS